MPDGTCNDDPECERPIYAGGRCSVHYQRAYRRGVVGRPKPCAVDGCATPRSSRGWCDLHYRRWRAHGDPLATSVIRDDDEARFWSKVDKDGPEPRPELGPCWVWIAGKSHDGYGQFSVSGSMVYAHRYGYELTVGPVPDGLELDHLCRTRACVRGLHLEPVTTRENLLRGETLTAANARKTHCAQGHPFDAGNTYVNPKGYRYCRECNRISAQRRRTVRRR